MSLKKLWKKSTAVLLAAALTASSLCGCSLFEKTTTPVPADTEQSAVSVQFDEFLNELFVEEVTSDSITLNYSVANPSNYGITDYTVGYGDLDLTNLDDTSDIVETLNTLKGFDYDQLTADQQLTYDVLKRTMEINLEYADMYLYEKILSPTIGLQSQLPVVLSEYSFRTTQDIYDYIELVKQTDEYFDYIMEIVKMQSDAGLFMEDAVADKVIDQCRLFIEDPENNYMIEVFNDKIAAFGGFSDAESARLIEEHKNAILEHLIPAYEHIIDVLTHLRGTNKYQGGLCNYPDGERYYEYLIRDDVGTDRSISKLSRLLDQYIELGIRDMSIALQTNPTLYQNLDSYDFCVSEPYAILQDLESRIATDFPKLPSYEYTIKYVHKSLEEYMSPAFYMVPAIDEYEQNSIYINQKSVDEGQELYSTLAHEGFPGHLLQNVYYLSTEPSPIRSQLNFSGYTEGWATYVEFQCYTMGAMDEQAGIVNAANSMVTLCLYGKMDIGINAYGWDQNDLKNYLVDYFGELDDEVIEEIYYAMVSEPANYLNYIIGAIEFMELRSQCEEQLGDKFSALDFHTAVLNAGPCDFTTLNKVVKNALGINNSDTDTTQNSQTTTGGGQKK
jgi:uncharacterized protein (DUF885 family)